MPRLLIVTTVAATVEAFLLPYARHYRAKGWQVDVLANGAKASRSCETAFDQVWDITWTRSPKDLGNLFVAPSRVRGVVRRGDYDLVHVHTPIAAFVTRIALRKMRRGGHPKVIYTAHGFHFHSGGGRIRNAAFAALERLAGRWTDRLIVMNREDELAASTRRIVSPGVLRHVPGVGLDLADYDPSNVSSSAVSELRAELGLEPDVPLFLMVAEFNPGKRHRDLLFAFSNLARRSDAHLLLAGRGRLMEEMRSLAVSLGIEGRVHFLGFRTDIPVLMRAACATVLASEREGLPRSVMESMALEVPVLGAAARGTRDLLENRGGILFPTGDRNALSGAMDWILDHPAEAVQMGIRGRQLMANYEIGALLSLHDKIYEELLLGVQ